MTFDWNEYLEVAKNLKASTDGQPKNNFNEAQQRSAISRAYYAVYHLAVDYAKAHLGYVESRRGQNQFHSDIRAVYQRQFGNPDHQEVRKMLMRLHTARVNSDYKSEGLGNTESLLGSIILEADRIKGILTS